MQLKNGGQTGKVVNEDLEKAGIDPTTAAPSQPDHQDVSRSDHSVGSLASQGGLAGAPAIGLTLTLSSFLFSKVN